MKGNQGLEMLGALCEADKKNGQQSGDRTAGGNTGNTSTAGQSVPNISSQGGPVNNPLNQHSLFQQAVAAVQQQQQQRQILAGLPPQLQQAVAVALHQQQNTQSAYSNPVLAAQNILIQAEVAAAKQQQDSWHALQYLLQQQSAAGAGTGAATGSAESRVPQLDTNSLALALAGKLNANSSANGSSSVANIAASSQTANPSAIVSNATPTSLTQPITGSVSSAQSASDVASEAKLPATNPTQGAASSNNSTSASTVSMSNRTSAALAGTSVNKSAPSMMSPPAVGPIAPMPNNRDGNTAAATVVSSVSMPNASGIVGMEMDREKKQMKRAANRRSAQLSRKRKKQYIEELKDENDHLRRKEMILRSIPDLVVVFDSSGRLGFVSESVGRVLKFKPSELEGTSFWNRLCDDSVRLLKAAFMDSLAARTPDSDTAPLGTGVWELRLVDKDDSFKVVTLNGVVHFTGEVPECVCSIRPREGTIPVLSPSSGTDSSSEKLGSKAAQVSMSSITKSGSSRGSSSDDLEIRALRHQSVLRNQESSNTTSTDSSNNSTAEESSPEGDNDESSPDAASSSSMGANSGDPTIKASAGNRKDTVRISDDGDTGTVMSDSGSDVVSSN